LDDRSTDHTVAKCRKHGAEVRIRKELDARMWGNEASARKELWDFALEYATEPDDWVLIADADMELHGDPRPLMQTELLNAWAWPLFDVWDSEQTYRSDNFWQGHLHPRLWMVKPNSQSLGFKPLFGQRGLHSGHLPGNIECLAGVAPPDVYWLHWGWMKEDHRKAKYQAYLGNSHLLSASERAHAASIIDA
jgi:glycosyltransferase involved in cell wall biosynthesis